MPHSTEGGRTIDTGLDWTGLQCLMMLARYHGIQISPEQLTHRYGQPGQSFANAHILRAAKGVGCKAKQVNSQWKRLADTPLPAIGRHKDGHYFIIAKVSEDRVLIQDPLEAQPQSLPREIFEQAWDNQLILIAKKGAQTDDERAFGFSWFIPAIIKYKRFFVEVLLVSMFIQILALILVPCGLEHLA